MDIEKIVEDILWELSGMETISKEHDLQTDLGLDSLELVALLIELEEQFGIELDESDMNPFDLISVQDIINLVEKYEDKANEKNC